MVRSVPGTQEAGALATVPAGHVEAVYAQEAAPALLYEPMGQAVGMTIGLPIYAGAVVAGHVAGRLPTEDASADVSEDAGD